MKLHTRVSTLVVVVIATGLAFAFSTRAVRAQEVATEASKSASGRAATFMETKSATVKAIDPATRTVTLQTDDGREIPVQCGANVRNFDQIKVGDVVKAAAIDRVALSLGSGGGAAAPEAGRMISRTPEGAKPGMLVADTEEITATVQSIDPEKRIVALKGPKGRVVPISVGPDVDLAKVKQGDDVTLSVTKGMAMWVEKPGEAQPAAIKIEDGAAAIESVTETATVEDVDADAHTITIKGGSSGKTKTIQLGKDVANFDLIKVGDKVRATLAEAVALSIGKPGETPPAADQDAAVVAVGQRGGKPGMLITETKQITGKIDAVDPDKRTVTLSIEGKPRTIKAGPAVDLSKLKAGDEVTARATQGLAIVVEKP